VTTFGSLKFRAKGRQEYLIERSVGRLTGRPLSLTSLYLERDDHVMGLIRLLTIALRVLTTLDYAVRARLAQEQRALPGFYAGNPTRVTTRPTAALLLTAFKDITLTVVHTPHLTLCTRRRRIDPSAPMWLDPSFSSSSFLACALISGKCGSRPLPSDLMRVKLHCDYWVKSHWR